MIIQNSKILGGKPIIAGTRMSVEVLLEFLAGGMEIKDALKEFPFLRKEQIEAALSFAAKEVGKKKSRSVQPNPTHSGVTPHEIHRWRQHYSDSNYLSKKK